MYRIGKQKGYVEGNERHRQPHHHPNLPVPPPYPPMPKKNKKNTNKL